MSDQTEVLPAQSLWLGLTTGEGTYCWIRAEQIAAYGDAPVGQGASWIQLVGVSERVYLLQTVQELHIMLGGTVANSEQAATEVDARDSVWVHPGRQRQTIESSSTEVRES